MPALFIIGVDVARFQHIKIKSLTNVRAFYFAFLLLTGVKEKAVSIDRRNLLNFDWSRNDWRNQNESK